MKYQIMIKILMLLLSKRKVCAREIAAKYDISVRSVYRYVEELIVSGIPVDVTRGRYGGISIADTFRLPAGYFTRDEYSASINALKAMASQVNDENILSALEKLQRQSKAESRDFTVSGGIIVDGGTWGDTRKFSDKMAVCEKAVNEGLCLDIDYISREGEHSRRIIDPHVLIFKQNVWYVYAFCHTKQDFRTFKIGRIKSARYTGKSFEKKKISREDIPLNFYYRSDELVDVKFEIEKQKLPDVEEWIGIDNIEPRGNAFIAELSLPDDDILVNKILSFGGGVKILSPESLREKVKLAAAKIIETV
ncbi:MAG: YafY family transcriptional regulator [Clostridia bacterium]|nr:YafY family transcriptional regulator [Clostridia bacterium]